MKNVSMFPCVQMKWLALFAGVCCLSIAAIASAEEGTQAGAKENRDRPCMADAAKLCKDVEKGQGRVAKCLKEHEGELSSACKDNMGKMKEKMHDKKEACEADAKKLCKDTKPGGGRIMQCLKEHEGELSSECKEQMGRRKGKM